MSNGYILAHLYVYFIQYLGHIKKFSNLLVFYPLQSAISERVGNISEKFSIPKIKECPFRRTLPEKTSRNRETGTGNGSGRDTGRRSVKFEAVKGKMPDEQVALEKMEELP